MQDKFKTCQNCPDRTVKPNCHTTCEGYLERCKKFEAIREAKKRYADTVSFDVEVAKKVYDINKKNKRRIHLIKK